MLDIKRTSAASVDRHIKALICGEPGTGKTLISSTFPDPLYLTTEGLMMSVADRDVPFHKLKTQDELLFAIKMLQQPAHVRAKQFGFPVGTIIVDTIDDLSVMLLKERMRAEKHAQAQLQDYGWLKDQMTEITTALRNLEMNVVLTCHLKPREVNGLTTLIPAIEGGFAEKIAGFVDLAVVLQSRLVTQVVGHDTVRVIERFMMTVQDPQHRFIKDHSGKLPTEFPINFEDDYERLATIIYGAPPVITMDPVIEEAVSTVPTPASEPVEAAPEPDGSLFAGAGETAENPRFTCGTCASTFDDEDQHDRSKIKFNQVLCLPCFNSKGQKRSA